MPRNPQVSELPLLAVSMGDPSGVGPELCLRLLNDPELAQKCRLLVFGCESILRQAAGVCGLRFSLPVIRPGARVDERARIGHFVVDCVSNADGIQPGVASHAGGRMAAECVSCAVEAAIEGRVAAVVTAPINKSALALAGVPFAGHTEMLAAMTGSSRVCMMLACRELVVSLVTTHVALREAPARLTKDRILDVLDLTRAAMARLLGRQPRIAVCGLNPHGGEGGLFGDEEERVIIPAIAEAGRRGILVEGPWPPDTAFLPSRRRASDAYVVMYHDQGLIPFKMLAFEEGVNITLGLPIVRTSPDHRTAMDIAWRGQASASSMKSAVEWALRLAGLGINPNL